jgi:outer membrane protein assembly factor BamB
MTRWLPALVLPMLLGGGWRGDGTAAFAGAPPETWTLGSCWSVALPPGNGTPVRFGDLVCTTAEPDEVVCVDAGSGGVRWRAKHPWTATLDPAAAAAWAAKEADLAAREAALPAQQRAYSALQREARRGDDPAVAAQLVSLSATLRATQTALAAVARERGTGDRGILGWTTETPVTDGARLFVLTGQGVLVAYGRDGTRLWIRDLGPAAPRLRGYDVGSAASPVLSGGVLVVPWGALRGLDPATGDARWTLRPYEDYGTPAALMVAGQPAVALPTGDVVAVDSGRYLARGLFDTWFVGPTAAGGRLLSLGGRSEGENRAAGEVPAVLFDAAPGLLRRWAASIPASDAFYTSPVLHGDHAAVVSARGRLTLFRLADGGVTAEADLGDLLGRSVVYPSPIVANDALWVVGDNGAVVAWAWPAGPARPAGQVGPTRGTPVVDGGRVYVRGREALHCLE